MQAPSLQTPLVLLGLLAAACQEPTDDPYQGYVEGELVFVSSSVGGTLEELAVREGDEVGAGELLFRLEGEPQTLQVDETELRVEQARARHADLSRGARPSEVAAVDARLAAARSLLDSAQHDLARRETLHEQGSQAVSVEELDRARTLVETRRAELASLTAERETLLLGGREDALRAAELEVSALEASLEVLRWQLGEKAGHAPAAGKVQHVLYRGGEHVPAGRPVVSLLPPESVKVRFFVPQAVLPTLQTGDAVRVRADGVEGELDARISFLSTEVEFTPPVIYSKQSRAKLVVMIEARPRPEDAPLLHPGQPVEVRID